MIHCGISYLLLAIGFLVVLFTQLSVPQVNGIPIEAVDQDSENDEWQKYVKKYGRKYESEAEYSQRLAIFNANAALVEKHNLEADEGLHSYRLALNKFADMTASEFKKEYLNLNKPDLMPKTDAVSYPTGLDSNSSLVDTLPTSYDMRTTNYSTLMNPIQDQGSCGSCWAFTTMALLEFQYAKRYGQLYKFSEQYLVDCDVLDSACKGGIPTFSLFYSSVTGIPLNSTYPYQNKANKNVNCDNMKRVTNSNYFYYNPLVSISDTQLQSLIVNVGMPIVSIDGSVLQFYDSGILDGTDCSDANHVVNAIGYYVDSSSSNNSTSNATSTGSYWILKNQWGKNWGENGYLRVKMNDNPCLIRDEVWYAEYN